MNEAEKKVSDIAAEWMKAKKASAEAVEVERALREKLVAAAFPNGLSEGTNTYDLPGKWKLKIVGVVDRKVDEAALPAILQRIREKFEGLDLADLVRYKPELKTAEYKKLLAAHPKIAKLFDNALTIKGTAETSPQVKIEEAKR